jgi:hypothetical protein
MARDAPARYQIGKLPSRRRRQLRGLAKGQNALGIQRKGELTPQAFFHLAFGQAEAPGDRIRNLQVDAHDPIESLRGPAGSLQRQGRRVGPQLTCLHRWGGLQPANARLRAHSFTPLKGMGASTADNGGTTAYTRRVLPASQRLQARCARLWPDPECAGIFPKAISWRPMGSPPSLRSEAPPRAQIRGRCALPGCDRAPRRSPQ